MCEEIHPERLLKNNVVYIHIYIHTHTQIHTMEYYSAMKKTKPCHL